MVDHKCYYLSILGRIWRFGTYVLRRHMHCEGVTVRFKRGYLERNGMYVHKGTLYNPPVGLHDTCKTLFAHNYAAETWYELVHKSNISLTIIADRGRHDRQEMLTRNHSSDSYHLDGRQVPLFTSRRLYHVQPRYSSANTPRRSNFRNVYQSYLFFFTWYVV